MLQRAASNACSWWWASHIRTKQSKWLEQSLQDMEEKVQTMLKLIEEEGDSFAKRAEMYYKRRPELINSVEEAYRSFRSLADRYDMLSKELQNANHTIATVFPEQVQFPMDDDEDCLTPKLNKNPQIFQENNGPTNIPKIPNAPTDDFKGLMTKKFKVKESTKKPDAKAKPGAAKSGLTKEEALKEIDGLQKEILELQTVKEFVKSSYEGGLAKYWAIESRIVEVQEKVCKLQDEFDVEIVIEDGEARTLMADAALKSCEEALSQLQEKQERSIAEAREEQKRIEEANELLNSIKNKFSQNNGPPLISEASDSVKVMKENEGTEIKKDLGSSSCGGSLTVSELAERIDELVNKVISLESAVQSQAVVINTLRTETDDLHAQIRSLEDEKETLIDGHKSLRERLREMEERLNKLQALNKNVEAQNYVLQTNFAKARSSLSHLSEKLSTVKPDEEAYEVNDSKGKLPEEEHASEIISNEEKLPEVSVTLKDEINHEEEVEEVVTVKEVVNLPVTEEHKEGEIKKPSKKTVTFVDQLPTKEEVSVSVSSPNHHTEASVKAEASQGENSKEELNWQQLLLNGAEDREKILLKEYTAILRNYKDVKRRLNDTEKKEKDSQFDVMLQMRELKKAILKRDHEIRILQQRLNALQGNKENKDKTVSDSDRDTELNNWGSDELDLSDIKLDLSGRNKTLSPVEEKLQTEIDSILNENLEFWLRFSTVVHQVQKFKSEVQDLQDEISNLKEKRKQEGSMNSRTKSEARPIYKHLREIETELAVWLENSRGLKTELKGRFSSLCSIQEEIVRALKQGLEGGGGDDDDVIRFSSHQAAKLQGEVLNMKQENNKVREELQSGLDHVGALREEIEKTLGKLSKEFGISCDQSGGLEKAPSRNKVPLRSFLFGNRGKKNKQSIFSFMHPSRKYQVVRAGVPLPSDR